MSFDHYNNNFNDVDLLVVAGEHSGDELGSCLVSSLIKNNQDLNIVCIGGDNLKKLKVSFLYNLVNHSVVGIVDVLKNYFFFKKIFTNTINWINKFKPKNILLIDYPGFNIRLAKELKNRNLSQKGGGAINIFYYVSPQIWAWKSYRRFVMAENINYLAVLLPFEKQFYADTNLPITYVGHPFAEPNYNLGIEYDSNAPILVLPGSRKNSVRKLFPKFLNALSGLDQKELDKGVVVLYPSNVILLELKRILVGYKQLKYKIKFLEKSNKVKTSLAILSSGTISLRVNLASIPCLVVYSMSLINYILIKNFVKVKYITLANLILNKSICKELIQSDTKSINIIKSINEITNNSDRKELISYSMQLKKILYEDIDDNVCTWLESKMKK